MQLGRLAIDVDRRIVGCEAEPDGIFRRGVDFQAEGCEMRLGGEKCGLVGRGISRDAGDTLCARARC